MRKGFFSRFFEGYTEERLPDEKGRLRTTRTYRDYWYVPELSKAQVILRAALYTLAYAGAAALVVLGASRRDLVNTLWYTGIGTGLSLICLAALAIPLLTCAFGRARQTVYQYRSGSRACVLWARITAAVLAFAALLLALAAAGNHADGMPALLFAAAGACIAAVGQAESRITYKKAYNENA